MEIESARRSFPQAPARHSPTARAIVSAAAVHIADVREDLELEEALRQIYRTVLSVPMIREGRAHGCHRRWRDGSSDRSPSSRSSCFRPSPTRRSSRSRTSACSRSCRRATPSSPRPWNSRPPPREILRVISRSPTDVQPVFDAIAESSVRLCSADYGSANRLEGDMIHLVSQHGQTAEWRATAQPTVPAPPDAGPDRGRVDAGSRVIHLEDMQLANAIPGEPGAGPDDGVPHRAERSDAPGQQAGRGVRGLSAGGPAVQRGGDRVAPHLRRPGRDRHRERAPVHRAGGAQP